MRDIKEVLSVDYKTKHEKVKAITNELESGITELFASDKYKDYLTAMSKFYRYSINNSMLIMFQKPDATYVAGLGSWNKNFNRHVKKGEKGIVIFAPAPYKIKVVNDEGEEEERTIPSFKPTYVFDISQTEGEELPTIQCDELEGNVKDYAMMSEALIAAAPCEVVFEDIASAAKGYYRDTEKKIVIQNGMSEVQTVKTLVHEIAHSMLHTKDVFKATGEVKDRETREVEAESVAYAFLRFYGIDTADYSFGYIAGWSEGKEVKILKESLETIRSTVSDLIDNVSKTIVELVAA